MELHATKRFRAGKRHSVYNTSYKFYGEIRFVRREVWYLEETIHRGAGPDYIHTLEDGFVTEEEWYLGGKRHRVYGPAVVHCREDGSVIYNEWCKEGRKGNK